MASKRRLCSCLRSWQASGEDTLVALEPDEWLRCNAQTQARSGFEPLEGDLSSYAKLAYLSFAQNSSNVLPRERDLSNQRCWSIPLEDSHINQRRTITMKQSITPTTT